MGAENLFGDAYRIDSQGNITSNWQQIISNGILRQGSDWIADGTDTLYTCPANKVFYVVSGMLQFITTAAVSATTIYYLAGGETLVLKSTGIDNDHDAVGLGFAFPIILRPGETIQMHSTNAGIRAYASFSGYEVPL